MTTFALLDPSLESFNGHFLTYDNSIAGEVAKTGLRPLVFSSVDVEKDLPIVGELFPAFRDPLERNFFRGPLTARILGRFNMRILQYRFLQDLKRELTVDRIGNNAIIYMHTTTPAQIQPLVDWVVANKRFAPTLVLMLRYAPSPNPYYPHSGSASSYRAALSYLHEKKAEGYIRLVTDSETLVEEYSYLTDTPIHLLPIPHTAHFEDCDQEQSTKLLTYLGNARATKGIHYLSHLISSLKNEFESEKWAAEFQANVMFGRDIDSVLAVKLLRRQEKVKLHEQELSIDEYSSLLCRSSLVLIPYQLLYYYAQTSGVLCEALAAGKPVIVPRGSWMSQQIKGKGIGETFLPGDRESLVLAVKKAMKNIDTLTANAQAFRSEWTSYHSPSNFVKELMKLVSQ